MPSVPQPAISTSRRRALPDLSRGERIETVARRVLISWPAAGVLGVAVLYFWPAARTSLPVQVSGAQTNIYITMVGVSGTLLGFTLAGLAILLALPEDRPLLKRIRNEGLHGEILRRL